MTTMTASALGSPRRHHALIPSPPPRCLKCGTTPTTPDVAELIETDELCPDCRAANLCDSATEIRDAVAALIRDSLPVMSAGLLPVEVEQLVVAYSAILAPDTPTATPIGIPDDIGVSLDVPDLSRYREQQHRCHREGDKWRARLMTAEPVIGGDPWGRWITELFDTPGEAIAWLREKAATVEFLPAFAGRE